MGFDRKAVPSTSDASEAGHTFEPRFPDGAPIGATITVYGPESRAARTLQREQLQRLQSLEATAKRSGQASDALSLALAQDPDEANRQKARSAAAYTKTWADFTDAGQPLPHSHEAALLIYAEHPWLADQVISKANDLGNFVTGLSKPCSNTSAPSSGST